VPEEIRGYGHVKERQAAAARLKWDTLRRRWSDGALKQAA
jgi:indolepyruvate ferredoxin oxidoreductase